MAKSDNPTNPAVEYIIKYQELMQKQKKELTELRTKYEAQGVPVLIAEKALAETKEDNRRRKRNREYTKKWQDKKSKS